MTDPRTIVFPFQKRAPVTKDTPKTLKWSYGDDNFEIHTHVLEAIGVENLLPHCVEVPSKIRKEVTDDVDVGSSLFKILPRALSLPLCAIWDQITEDIPPPLQTSERFHEMMLRFVAVHAAPDDRRDLVSQ
jgi:hypothetical protein